MTKLHFALFLIIAFTVFFGMHYFVYSRIANGLRLTGAGRVWLRVFFLAAAFLFVITEFITHRGAADWMNPAAFLGFTWLGVLAIAFGIFLVVDLLRLLIQDAPFRYQATVAALALLFAATVYSLINVALGPSIKEIVIKTDKLPADIERFAIVQLSDLHIDMLSSEKWLENIVARTNALEPDIVLITGDLMDGPIQKRPAICEILKKLKNRHGVYAISGNHEIYSGMDNFIKLAEASGITILDGRKRDIAGIVELVGIDDELAARSGKAEEDIRKILLQAPAASPSKFTILLGHRPDVFIAAQKIGIDLTLSGHTHAGQIPPMDLLVYLAYKYPWGFSKEGDSYSYVTTGTHIWGPPMRLFSRSEIVRIVLER